MSFVTSLQRPLQALEQHKGLSKDSLKTTFNLFPPYHKLSKVVQVVLQSSVSLAMLSRRRMVAAQRCGHTPS
jgi:hypothetical protein